MNITFKGFYDPSKEVAVVSNNERTRVYTQEDRLPQTKFMELLGMDVFNRQSKS